MLRARCPPPPRVTVIPPPEALEHIVINDHVVRASVLRTARRFHVEVLITPTVTEVIPLKRDFANVTLKSDPRSIVGQELGIGYCNVFREGHRRLITFRYHVQAIAMRLDEFH